MGGRSRYIGFGVTIVFIGLLVWKTDVKELLTALAEANYLWVVPAIATTLTSYALRTGRWERILRPIQSLPFRTLLPVVFIGFMANNLLPARMGEVVRAYALGRKTGLSKSMGLATILLERLCDGITLLVALGLVSILFPLPVWGRQTGLVAGAIFLVGAAGAGLVLAREELALSLVERLLGPVPFGLGRRILPRLESFLVGLRVLHSGRAIAEITLWSLVIWTIETSTYFFVLKSVHPTLSVGTPVIAALLLMVTVNLGILVPSAPGYVGAFQAFGVLALSAFGVPTSVALAITIVAHAEQWLIVTGIGLFFVARESVRLGSLTVESPAPAGTASTTGA
jgi:glycosyltransferase 2 family protein